MTTHRTMMILGAGVLLGLTLSAVSAGLIDLTSPGVGDSATAVAKSRVATARSFWSMKDG